MYISIYYNQSSKHILSASEDLILLMICMLLASFFLDTNPTSMGRLSYSYIFILGDITLAYGMMQIH